MEAVLSIKLILYFATNCPRRVVRDELSCEELSATSCPRRIVLRRIVRDELSATNCPATNCPRRVVRDELSCDELSGNPRFRSRLYSFSENDKDDVMIQKMNLLGFLLLLVDWLLSVTVLK